MASVNKVILVGNLGKDPELRYTQSGVAVCSFSLATTDNWTSDGERHEKTEWHNIVVWKKQAENCAQFLRKGSSAYVEGRIQTRSWDDQQSGQKRYKTEIIADSVKFLGSSNGQSRNQPPAPTDDDIPGNIRDRDSVSSDDPAPATNPASVIRETVAAVQGMEKKGAKGKNAANSFQAPPPADDSELETAATFGSGSSLDDIPF